MVDNGLFSDRIHQIQGDSKSIYGEPKIRAYYLMGVLPNETQSSWLQCKHRVTRLMLARWLQGVCKRRSYTG